MFKTIPFAKGVNLHIRQTTQFKTVNFSIKWRKALTATNASERTVLTNVLQHSNAKYKTTAAFRSFWMTCMAQCYILTHLNVVMNIQY